MVFSWYIVGYLFVAGVASGAFFVSFGACLWDRWRQSKASERAVAAVQLGFYIAPVWSFAAIALLLLDLGNPERLLSLVMSPFDSVIGAGAWLLGLFFLLTAVLALQGMLGREVPRLLQLLLGIPAALCAVGVMTYTGVLLSSLIAIEFWYSPLLVALFIASSLTTGTASIIVCNALFGTPSAIRTLGGMWRVCFALSIVEAAVLASFAWSQAHGTPMAVESCTALLSGPLALPFWAGVCLVGFVIPWAFHVARPLTSAPVALSVSSAGVLVGGFMLRYCVVGAGLFAPLVLGPALAGL